MTYLTHTLSCGLRVLLCPSDSPVVYCGYMLSAGTRHEPEGMEGLAHFVEHMSFKGTERRKSHQLGDPLERVGGDLNAFTAKEHTAYHAVVPATHVAKAVDVLSDMVFHSVYPQREIDKEVEVIVEEIESFNDTPAELIYDEFEQLLFAGHPLSRNVLGNAERVRQMTTADAVAFAREHYRPERAVFFASGRVDMDRLVRLLEKALSGQPQAAPVLPSLEPLHAPAPVRQQVVSLLDTSQAHVMMGHRTFGEVHPDRMTLVLMNTVLGGPAMSSRLNRTLRERRGLVYQVDAFPMMYTDTGLWSVYFGCDPHNVARCRRLVRAEMDRIATQPLTPHALRQAKQQLKGLMTIGADNRENTILDATKVFLRRGYIPPREQTDARIDAVTAADIQRVAAQVFDEDSMTTLIYR